MYLKEIQASGFKSFAEKIEININDGIRIIGNNDTGTIVTIMYKNGSRVNSASKGDIISIPLKDKVNVNDIVVLPNDHYGKTFDDVSGIIDNRESYLYAGLSYVLSKNIISLKCSPKYS